MKDRTGLKPVQETIARVEVKYYRNIDNTTNIEIPRRNQQPLITYQKTGPKLKDTKILSNFQHHGYLDIHARQQLNSV